MTIQVTCSSCYRTYGVKNEYAGRRIKCPDCGSAVQIPDGSEPAPADEFGGDDFGSAPSTPPRPRSRQPGSTSRKSNSGLSLPVVGIILGLVGVFIVLPCCGGIIWFAVNFEIDDEPIAAAEQDDQLGQALADRQVSETREESGRLSSTDSTFKDGEYYDEYTISANAGDTFVIDLYSDEFDPFLTVRDGYDTGGFELTNDDFGSSTSHSQVILTAPDTGDYIVFATTFAGGETGAYQLNIREVETGSGAGGPIREETGTLESGDDTLDFSKGEYTDIYTLDAQQGGFYVIDLYSDQFDTYLYITGPNEYALENDDFGTIDHSQITLLVPETGEYEINVTSLDAGETGSYRLTIQEQ